jgi:hypothetical protein
VGVAGDDRRFVADGAGGVDGVAVADDLGLVAVGGGAAVDDAQAGRGGVLDRWHRSRILERAWPAPA